MKKLIVVLLMIAACAPAWGRWYLTIDQGSGHQEVDSITLTTGQTVTVGIWSSDLTTVTDTPPTELTTGEFYGAMTLRADNTVNDGPDFAAFSNPVINANMGVGASPIDLSGGIYAYFAHTAWYQVPTPAPAAAGLWAEWTFTLGYDDFPGSIQLLTRNADYSDRAVWDTVLVNPERWYTGRVSELPEVPGALALNEFEQKQMTIEIGQPVYFQWTSERADVIDVEPTAYTEHSAYHAWTVQSWTYPAWGSLPASESWSDLYINTALVPTGTGYAGTNNVFMGSYDSDWLLTGANGPGVWFATRWNAAEVGDRIAQFGSYTVGYTEHRYPQRVVFHQIAADASRYPAIDANIQIEDSTVLEWGARTGAVNYKIYFGDNEQAVYLADETAAEYKGTVPASTLSYDAGPFAQGKTYYWRIDTQDAIQVMSRGRLCAFSVAIKECLRPTDFDHNCQVNITDLMMLVADWLKNEVTVTTWENDMSVDPAGNGWVVRGGASGYTTSGGVMNINSVQWGTILDARPSIAFGGTTDIRLIWRATSVTTPNTLTGLGLWFNADNFGVSYDPITFIAVLNGSGNQQVEIYGSGGATLIATETGFGSGYLTLNATIDAAANSVTYQITDGTTTKSNTIAYSSIAQPVTQDWGATIFTAGAAGQIDYLKIVNSSPYIPQTDLTGNDFVDLADFALFAADWLEVD